MIDKKSRNRMITLMLSAAIATTSVSPAMAEPVTMSGNSKVSAGSLSNNKEIPSMSDNEKNDFVRIGSSHKSVYGLGYLNDQNYAVSGLVNNGNGDKNTFSEKRTNIELGRSADLSTSVDVRCISFMSSRPEIVEVTPGGTATALKVGTATVYGYYNEGKKVKTAKIKITVKKPKTDGALNASVLYLVKGSKRVSLPMPKNAKKKTVKVTVTSDASFSRNQLEKYAAVNPKDVAQIFGRKVYGKNAGDCILHYEFELKSGEKRTADLPVHVSETSLKRTNMVTLKAGEARKLDVGTIQHGFWAADKKQLKKQVAVIDQYGVIYGIQPGEAQIKIKLDDRKTRIIKVTVSEKAAAVEEKNEFIKPQRADENTTLWYADNCDYKEEWLATKTIKFKLPDGVMNDPRNKEVIELNKDTPLYSDIQYRNHIFLYWLLDGSPATYIPEKYSGAGVVEAVFGETAYDVVFNLNGGRAADGSESIASQVINISENAVRPEDPVRDGYKFGGWNLDGYNYNFTEPLKKNITLEAVWLLDADNDDIQDGGDDRNNPYGYVKESTSENSTEKSDNDGGKDDSESRKSDRDDTKNVNPLYRHIVALDAAGGKFDDGTEYKVTDVCTGGALNLDKLIPSREGCKFKGWYTADGRKYDSSDAIKRDTIFIAHWIDPDGYELSGIRPMVFFNDMHGSIFGIKTNIDKTVSAPSVSRRDFSFDSWRYSDNRVYSERDTFENDAFLYAVWNSDKLVGMRLVTFDVDGGTEITPNPQKVKDGYRVNIPDPDTTRKGYSNGGWTDGEFLYDWERPVKKNLSLTPHWIKDGDTEHKVYIDAGCGTFEETGTRSVVKYIKDNEKISINAVPVADSEHAGYEFAGWYYSDGTKIKEDDVLTDDLSIKAGWYDENGNGPVFNDGSFIVFFDNMHGTIYHRIVKKGSSLKAPDAGEWKEHEFRYWMDSNNGKYSENRIFQSTEIFYAQWLERSDNASEYTVTLIPGNGEKPEVQKINKGKKASAWIPEYKGYTFGGWQEVNEDGEVSPEIFDFTMPINSDVTLQAKWFEGSSVLRANYYAVVLDANIGTIDGRRYVTITTEPEKPVELGSIATPTVEGKNYEFAGWYDTEGRKHKDSDVITKDIVLEAGWYDNDNDPAHKHVILPKPGKEYPIMVYFNDKHGTIYARKADEKSHTVKAPVPVYEGYYFTAWLYADDMTRYNAADKFDKDTILYAAWRSSEEAFLVFFDGNGGLGAMDAVEYTSREKVVIPTVGFKKNGFSALKGKEWNLNADGTGKVFSAGESKSLENMGRQGKVTTLHAQWSPNILKVTFDGTDAVDTSGGMLNDVITVKYGDTVRLPKVTFKRQGYEFVEWKRTGSSDRWSDGDDFTNDITVNGDDSIVLKAVWKAKKTTYTYHKGTESITSAADASKAFVGSASLPDNLGLNDTVVDSDNQSNPEKQVKFASLDASESAILPGYKFIGWNTRADLKGTSYKAGSIVPGRESAENGITIDLYAMWQPVEYTITSSVTSKSDEQGKVKRTYTIEDVDYILPTDCIKTVEEGRYGRFLYWESSVEPKGTGFKRAVPKRGNSGKNKISEPTVLLHGSYGNINIKAVYDNVPVAHENMWLTVFTQGTDKKYIPVEKYVTYESVSKETGKIQTFRSVDTDTGKTSGAIISEIDKPLKYGYHFADSWFSTGLVMATVDQKSHKTKVTFAKNRDGVIIGNYLPNDYRITYAKGISTTGNNVTQDITFDRSFTTKPNTVFHKTGCNQVAWSRNKDIAGKVYDTKGVLSVDGQKFNGQILHKNNVGNGDILGMNEIANVTNTAEVADSVAVSNVNFYDENQRTLYPVYVDAYRQLTVTKGTGISAVEFSKESFGAGIKYHKNNGSIAETFKYGTKITYTATCADGYAFDANGTKTKTFSLTMGEEDKVISPDATHAYLTVANGAGVKETAGSGYYAFNSDVKVECLAYVKGYRAADVKTAHIGNAPKVQVINATEAELIVKGSVGVKKTTGSGWYKLGTKVTYTGEAEWSDVRHYNMENGQKKQSITITVTAPAEKAMTAKRAQCYLVIDWNGAVPTNGADTTGWYDISHVINAGSPQRAGFVFEGKSIDSVPDSDRATCKMNFAKYYHVHVSVGALGGTGTVAASDATVREGGSWSFTWNGSDRKLYINGSVARDHFNKNETYSITNITRDMTISISGSIGKGRNELYVNY